MINFQRDLAELVMNGRKTETRRIANDKATSPWYRERCGFEPGQRHAVCCGRGSGPAIGRIMVDEVDLVRLGTITHEGAVAEGCGDVRDFMETWTRIHGSMDPEQMVWRVRFHVIESAVPA